MTKPTEEQWAIIEREVALARGRAVSGEDGWDYYYSPVADRIRIACAELSAGQVERVANARELMAMTEGG